MLRIVSHIEQLLLTHNCVVIPQVGGLVFQYESTPLSADTTQFVPTRRVVVLDPTYQDDDQLLLHTYEAAYGLNEKYARRMLLTDIGLLRSTLQKRGEVLIGINGRLIRHSNGQISFQSKVNETFDLEAYGLPTFQFEKLPVAEEKTEEIPVSKPSRFSFFHKKQKLSTTPIVVDKPVDNVVEKPAPIKEESDTEEVVTTIPLGWKILQTAAVSAAAVAFFLLISTPVEDVKTSAFQASMLPTEQMLSSKPAPVSSQEPVVKMQETAPKEVQPVVEEVQESSRVATPEVTQPKVDKAVTETKREDKATSEKKQTSNETAVKKQTAKATVAKKQPAQSSQETKLAAVRSGKKYYVIIGSFPNEAQANQFIKQVDKQKYAQVGKVMRGYKYRVYAAQYSERAAAEKYLDQVRKDKRYQDAWLFISR